MSTSKPVMLMFLLRTYVKVLADWLVEALAPGYAAEGKWRKELLDQGHSTLERVRSHLDELERVLGKDRPEWWKRRACQLTRYVLVRGAELHAEAKLARLCRFWQEPSYAWDEALLERATALLHKTVEELRGTPYEANCQRRAEYVDSHITLWCRRRSRAERETLVAAPRTK